MSKILIIEANFPPEPVVAARMAHDLVSVLSDIQQITVLSPKPTRPYGFDFNSAKISNGKFTRIEMNSHTCPQSSLTGRFRESYSFGIETARYIREHHHEIDVIYADTWPLFGQYFIVRAAKKFHLPVAIHVQDVYPQSLANKFRALSPVINLLLMPIDRYVLKNASAIIAISDQMKDYLAETRKIYKDKISVVLNWQDESSFLKFEEFNAEADKFTFMYLGNIGPVAGIDLLIDAFVMAKIPDSRLVIAGSGSMKAGLIKKASAFHESDIQFWDVPEGKVADCQSKANIMLLPIKKGAASSSLPSKLPAYMFSAKPIVCCADVDSFTAECIRDAGCGWVVEPENSEELSKTLISISRQNKSVLGLIGESGRKYAHDKFSKDANINKLTTVITDLINS